jgi:predicted small secreted protein
MSSKVFNRSLIVLAAAFVLMAGLPGCNTTEGVGKDVKAAGAGIEGAARDAK